MLKLLIKTQTRRQLPQAVRAQCIVHKIQQPLFFSSQLCKLITFLAKRAFSQRVCFESPQLDRRDRDRA